MSNVLSGITSFDNQLVHAFHDIEEVPQSMQLGADGVPYDTSKVGPDTTAPSRSLYNVNGKADFSNKGMPSINDVKQEGYGDCYFDSSIASLVQKHPEQIKNMIHDNGNGTFTVTFPHQKDNGAGNLWGLFGDSYHDVKVTVSDKDMPANATNAGAGNAKWPEVLEAAYAKLNGGYSKIGNGGNPTNAMNTLTGKGADYYSPSDGAGKIQQALKAGKMVTVLTPDADGDQAGAENGTNPHGLVGEHAYTVTGVTKGADGKTYVQLRNPWGFDQPQKISLDQLAHDGSINEVEIGNP
jgi:Calpain family cysteine protease